MNAIMVCVDYSDILAITLPYNRHHFKEVVVVTSFEDEKTWDYVTKFPTPTHCYRSDGFCRNGATFNKWLALEEGLDYMRRQGLLEGWLCQMDADVLWPKSMPTSIYNGCPWDIHALGNANIGKLWSPLRRMWNEWPQPLDNPAWYENGVLREEEWRRLPVHRNIAEWAGYSQIFHTSDPVLGPAPWHQTDWKHAGGADSFFQQKWAPANKLRPPFEVLHLGPAGQNWYGRATPLADGSVPEGAMEKGRLVHNLWMERAQRRAQGLEPFGPEKIPGA